MHTNIHKNITTVGLLGRATLEEKQITHKVIESIHIVTWKPNDTKPLTETLQQCDVVVVGSDAAHHGFGVLDLTKLPNLRLIILPFAGHDWLPAERLPSGCIACNVKEHGVAVAEYVLGSILHWEQHLDRLDQFFRSGNWQDWGAKGDTVHGELAGKQIGLIGYGVIGQAVAIRASVFGMKVVTVTKSARQPESPLAWHGGKERLEELVTQSDYIILACDLNAQTKGLINSRMLSLMKQNTLLINVARASVVDEAALFQALEKHQIGGAVLDVWWNYPTIEQPSMRPSELPFWTLNNVIMTPHSSAATTRREYRCWKSVAESLEQYINGMPVKNIFAVGM